jgi:hypothetical protein
VRHYALNVILSVLLAVPAAGVDVIEPADLAALQKRWPRPLALIMQRLEEPPRESEPDRPAVSSSLKAAAAFLRADELQDAARVEAKAVAAREFQAGLDALGPRSARFLEREGGLGVIAREVLGADTLVSILGRGASDEPAGLLSMRAEALYFAGRYQEAARAAAEAWKLSAGQDKDALLILRSSEGRVAPSQASGISKAAGHAPLPIAVAAEARPIVMTSIPKSEKLAVPELDILDDETAAPEPTSVDRVMALLAPTKDTVVEDLKTLRSRIGGFEVPDETRSLGSSNLEAPRSFLAWIKNVSDKDLPAVSYGILPAGQIATYKPGFLGSRGKIVMNYHVRGAEPSARSAVLLHELYHYWDFEIEKNPYPNISYGHHSKEGIARREYDAYRLTALYWAQVNSGDATSPLARSLTTLPSETDELQRRVDALVSRRKDEK